MYSILFAILCCLALASSAIDVQYGGPVAFSFPCNDNPRYLTQEYHVNGANFTKWKGIFYVDQWVNKVNVKLDMVLDTPVTIEVNPRTVHIIDLDGEEKKSFRLTTLQSLNTTTRIEFKVIGTEGTKLPNLLSLAVNGITLCDNRDRKTNGDLIQGLKNEPTVTEVVKKQCGMRHPILAETKENIDWPWRISLYYNDGRSGSEWTLVCGGTLIGQNKVVTAANCLKDRDAKRFLVEINRNSNVTVKDLRMHNQFDSAQLKDDIAVLQIEEEAKDNGGSGRFPICVYSDWAKKDNMTMGAVDRDTNSFQELAIENSLVCLEANRVDFGNYLSTKNFCAKGKSSDEEILSGDGYYEEYFNEERKSYAWKIKGIASFVKRNADSKIQPFYIFTDASKYYSWIESNL